MSDAIRIAHIDDIAVGEAFVVGPEITGFTAQIAIFHSDDGNWYALNDTCTHADASLADGWIEDDEVECPLHSARFCLKTGKVRSLPATHDARTHRIEVRDDQVYLYPGVPALGQQG